MVRSHLDFVQQFIDSLDSKLDDLIAPYENAVYQMLSTGETWNPCDLYKTDMPLGMQDKQKAKAVKQALKLLISESVVIPPESIPTKA